MAIHAVRSGTGRTVVFIHGAGGSSRSWSLQQEDLSDCAETVVIDLPGRGQSSGFGLCRVEEYRDAVLDFAENLGPGRYHLAGHSMGGAIALSVALERPDLLQGLILVATSAHFVVNPAILDNIVARKEEMVPKLMGWAFSRKAPRSLVENGTAELMETRGEVIFGDFLACSNFDVRERLAEIRVPTLIICGTDDVLTRASEAEELHRGISGSRLVLVPDAGHMVMIEKPEETNRAIRDFLGCASA